MIRSTTSRVVMLAPYLRSCWISTSCSKATPHSSGPQPRCVAAVVGPHGASNGVCGGACAGACGGPDAGRPRGGERQPCASERGTAAPNAVALACEGDCGAALACEGGCGAGGNGGARGGSSGECGDCEPRVRSLTATWGTLALADAPWPHAPGPARTGDVGLPKQRASALGDLSAAFAPWGGATATCTGGGVAPRPQQLWDRATPPGQAPGLVCCSSAAASGRATSRAGPASRSGAVSHGATWKGAAWGCTSRQ
mmetsp:Transcript_71278/g.230859  ORF Transcript_71278/g.230859 Transcript_71278/m.230859 type:complete len:255 (+) Transcript_71278:734-1498(+)